MPNILSSELIAQFQTALREGWGYIYGASGEIWTQAQQNAASREQTKKYGQKWVGHRVADCSGLFAWAFRQLGGYCYHGSNTMFRRYSSASGSLSAGKRTDGEPLKPGTAVYKFNASEGYHHVGLYIGEGAVIEAKGTAYGVVTSKIDSGWTHWGELKGVDYAEKACKEKVKPQIGLAARKFGRRWGEKKCSTNKPPQSAGLKREKRK